MSTTNQEICTPLTSPGWTWVLPEFSTSSFLATADLVPQFAVPLLLNGRKSSVKACWAVK